MPEINVQKLKNVRENRGLSQSALAKKSRVTKRQIQRLEQRNDSETVTVREHTLKRLARALGVREETLSTAPDEDGDTTQSRNPWHAPMATVATSIDPVAAQCLDLVCNHYRVTARDVISIAPALFVLAAEDSLIKRRKTLAEHRQKINTANSPTDFGLDGTNDFTEWQMWLLGDHETEGSEDYSIAQADLTGRLGSIRLGDEYDDFDHEQIDEFCDYLSDLVVAKLPELPLGTFAPSFRNQMDLHDHYSQTKMLQLRVLRHKLSQIAGGDSDARKALDDGWVRVSEIPPELHDAIHTSERVEWIKWMYAKRRPPPSQAFVEHADEMDDESENAERNAETEAQ